MNQRRWLVVATLLVVVPADATTALTMRRSRAVIEEHFGESGSGAFVGVHGPHNARWRATSGRLLLEGGAGSSGDPERDGTAVTRIVSRADDLTDVRVRLRLSPVRFVTTARTPAQAWDGVHISLRYISPEEMYYVSLSRRDGFVTIKKKLPGGPSAGGHYVTLASARRGHLDRWVDASVEIRTGAEGTVAITLHIDGELALRAADDGLHGPTIDRGGAIGLRADNAAFLIDDLTVERM